MGVGEPLPLGHLTHCSSHCPQGLTPEGCTTLMFFKSFSETEKEGGFSSWRGPRWEELWVFPAKPCSFPGNMQFQGMAIGWRTNPRNGDAQILPGIPESRWSLPKPAACPALGPGPQSHADRDGRVLRACVDLSVSPAHLSEHPLQAFQREKGLSPGRTAGLSPLCPLSLILGAQRPRGGQACPLGLPGVSEEDSGRVLCHKPRSQL